METASTDQDARDDKDTEERAQEQPEPASEPSSAPAQKPVVSSPFPDKSPRDGSALAPVKATDPASISGLVERARTAQKAWAETPIRDRAAVVLEVKRVLLARADEIANVVHKECGKPIEEAALAEVLPNADLIDYWTFTIEELLDATLVELDALAYPGKLGRVIRDPRGVVALITPWNYPVAIPLRTLVPALLAGNAVIFKPSEITPRSGALVASLFEGLLPEGVLQIAQGGGDVGAALAQADVDLVVFTGSVATGKKIAVTCAERLIPCSLELGGKDAAIVLADAKIERAANGVVWGAFTNAGQNCASIERVYVDASIADAFTKKVVELSKALDPKRDLAVITTRRQADVVRRHLDDAIEKGAEVLCGGAPDDPDDLAFPATVVKVKDENTLLMQEETFGPVLPIVVTKSEDDAITRANASKFGLTTSVWTRRVGRAEELTKKLKSGVVTINNHGFTAAIPSAPWTGTGASGYGITNSPHALAELTRPRFVLEDRAGGARELWWYPYTPALRAVAFEMAKARGGAGFFGRIVAFFRLLMVLPKRLFGG